MQPVKTRASRAAKGGPGIHLRYSLSLGEQRGAELDNPLFALLEAVSSTGSIRHGARALGLSYRFVWGSLHQWERELGEPLIAWSQGRSAELTPFAQRLLWAERRARTRMQPHIEALRADLARVFVEARDERHQLLKLRASHDLALPLLQAHAANAADLHLDIGFQGSVDALRALNDRQCVVAGFHVPVLRSRTSIFAKALKPLLRPDTHQLIACSRRTQGLMMRKEHAARIRSPTDVVQWRLRFVNRQPGSGTRMLVDHIMNEYSIDPARLPGFFDHIEHSHVAVALCVASGVADVGVGVEAAAMQVGLHFVPIVEEDYYLALLGTGAETLGVQRLREVLGGSTWREILTRLAGYQPTADAGKLLAVNAALPWWRDPRRAVKGRQKPPARAK